MAFIHIPCAAWVDFEFTRRRTILDRKPVENNSAPTTNIRRRFANRPFRSVNVSPVVVVIYEVVEEMSIINVRAR
jgi:hypothetical protein